MTQADVNRTVAVQNGESVRMIAWLGFSRPEMREVDPEPEQTRSFLMVDWDALDWLRRAA